MDKFELLEDICIILFFIGAFTMGVLHGNEILKSTKIVTINAKGAEVAVYFVAGICCYLIPIFLITKIILRLKNRKK